MEGGCKCTGHCYFFSTEQLNFEAPLISKLTLPSKEKLGLYSPPTSPVIIPPLSSSEVWNLNDPTDIVKKKCRDFLDSVVCGDLFILV